MSAKIYEKVARIQDSTFKIEANTSNEASIFISRDAVSILNLVNEQEITINIYKEDYLKAISFITSYSDNGKLYYKKVPFDYSNEWFSDQIKRIETFFGDSDYAEYNMNVILREDGRNYFNGLNNNGFNARDFLVQDHSILKFSVEGEEINLEIKQVIVPVPRTEERFDLYSETPQEREERFRKFLFDRSLKQRTVVNYISVLKRKSFIEIINKEYGIVVNSVFEYIDKVKLQQIDFAIDSLDKLNKSHNYTFSAALNKYLEFLNSTPLPDKEPDKIYTDDEARNVIYYGAPGTGKSHTIEDKTKDICLNCIRTTFHPESDYASFVGAYKPAKDKEDKITYEFSAQAFARIYVKAWNNLEEKYCLIIEEINRGNCAQIFGDIFQLLDRDEEGFSKYKINIDTDFARYIQEKITFQDYINYVGDFNTIFLPPNLYIYASMNTSDQSLFPMDSAFKRRWDWVYIPINLEDASQFIIRVDDNTKFKWSEFLEKINKEIYRITLSEDKQLGNRFVKADKNKEITFDQFRSKVMFYLWDEIFKDEVETNNNLFIRKDGVAFAYKDLFTEEGVVIIKEFFITLGIEPC